MSTRTSLCDQQKLVTEKMLDVEKAQRILELVERDLGRQITDQTKQESQLKASEDAQRHAREKCRVR